MSTIRTRLERLERQDGRTDLLRRTVGVGVLPGDDEEERIREACERAGIPREIAQLAIIRVTCTDEGYDPADPDAGFAPAESDGRHGD